MQATQIQTERRVVARHNIAPFEGRGEVEPHPFKRLEYIRLLFGQSVGVDKHDSAVALCRYFYRPFRAYPLLFNADNSHARIEGIFKTLVSVCKNFAILIPIAVAEIVGAEFINGTVARSIELLF